MRYTDLVSVRLVMAKVARLLEKIKPERYGLDIDLDMKDFSFAVCEFIDFELTRASHTLVLHAVRLEVIHVILDGRSSPVKVEMSAEDETVSLEFAEEVASGRHTISLKARGTLNESLRGFYRSTYTHGGREHSLATTQFEAVHAREAFVCVDEPSAKAVFELSMTVPEGTTAISNTNATEVEPAGKGRKRVSFEPTPKMSTYLLAYLVGEFEYLEKTTPEGVRVRVYATPGKKNQLDFALETAVRTLSFFTDYFGIPYPLRKMDMIAVPDFAAGAMENWGAVTYRETALLLDPEKTSLSHKQRVVEVVAHELAHQWFGNLVTMAWWDDIWLNEGFATWVEVLAMDHLFPEWSPWEEFAATNVAYAMELDGLANTHPIQVPVDDPRSLDEIFDAISYSKGASIIDMLHHYLGAEVFKKGLQTYLNRHKFGNTVTHDLWKALGEASGKPVDEVMSAWTSRPGYPIVSFEDGQITQRRFYSSPREAKKAGNVVTDWPIPFGVVLPDGKETPQMLVTGPTDLPDVAMAADWFKPNPDQTAFFRTQYTGPMIEALSGPLQEKHVAPKDRFGIVNDVFAGTEAGHTDSVSALKLVASLRDETDYVVWNALSGGLAGLIAVVEDDAIRAQFDAFGLWMVQTNVKRLGWTARPKEVPFDTLMRPLVLQLAVRFDDKKVTAKALNQFQEYMNGTELDPDLRGVALYAAARNGSQAEYDAILARYRVEASPQVKMTLLASLGRFRDITIIEQFLQLGISDDVRPQDLFMVLAWGFRSREGRFATWNFMKQHWGLFLKRYGAGGHMLERFPIYAADGFATQEMADEIKAFFAAHPHPAITRPSAQAVESVGIKADWFKRDGAGMAEYLSEWAKTNRA
jgi:puromycin-sensitive aminopeptidase